MGKDKAVLKKIRVVLSVLLAVSTVMVMQFQILQPVYAASDVPYIDANGTLQTAATTTDITTTTTTWTDGWYAVPSSPTTTQVQISSLVTISGDVNLILPDNTQLITAGINVPVGSTLNIYAQSVGNGTLQSTGGQSQAGIGGIGVTAGTTTTADNGTINIYGGFIYATGGNNGAGIGGGANSNGGNINIYGGNITAEGGGYGGAGIGGGTADPGQSGYSSGSGGTIVITGGTVNATGNSSVSSSTSVGGGAGIGGGGANNDNIYFGGNTPGPSGPSGSITISGNANVTATGGDGAAAYGSGGAGIGSGGGGGGQSPVGNVSPIYINTTGTVSASGGTGSSTDERLHGANVGYGGTYIADTTAAGAEMPAVPQNLKTVSGDGQVTINWNQPQSTSSQAFAYTVTLVNYQVSTDNNTWTNVSPSTLTYTFTGLTNGTSYNFYVRAVYSTSSATASATVSVPGAPNSATATPLSSAKAITSFTFAGVNGTINESAGTIAVSVLYGTNITSQTPTISFTGASISPTTAQDFTNPVTYTVTAQDGTTKSYTVTVTVIPIPPDAPQSVTAAPGNSQATVSFLPPGSNGGSAITSYTVYATPSGGGSTVTASGAASPITVTGLTNGTSYSFTVTATNVAGEGSASSAVTATPRTVPSAPQSVSSTPGNSQITANFSPPASNGGNAITSYTATATSLSDGSTVTASGAASPLTIAGLTNGTTYSITVTATNDAGTGPASSPAVTAVPYTVPDAPQNVAAAIGDSQLTVSFSPPASNGGSAITGYTVTATPTGGGQAVTSTGSSSPIVIAGLTNGTEYDVTVTATNMAGTGAASSAVTATPSTTPSAPQNVTATPGDSQITVTFLPPATNGGSAVTGYEVSTDGGTTWPTALASTATGTTISGLANGTAYQVCVRAVNADGAGTSSAPVPATPLTTPSAPLNISAAPGNGQVTLSWTAPASNGGSAITSYQYSSDGGNTWTSVPGSGASTTSYTVTGLTNGTAYNFAVRAVNAAGSGAAAMTAATPFTTPSAPQSLTATPSDGQIALTWAAPSSDGGSAITSYQYSTDGGNTWATITGSNASTTSYAVSGLTNGTSYTVEICAVNAAGPGSPASVNSTPVAIPSAPQNLAAVHGDTQVTLTWDPPSDNGGSAIDFYTLTITDPGGNDTPIEYASSPYVAGSLTDGDTYTFTVTATNNAGLTGAPATVQATPSSVPMAPINLMATPGNGQVALVWTAPQEVTDAIESYEYSTDGGATWKPIPGSDGTTTSFTVDGLVNGTTYSIAIRADNDIGFGASSVVTATPYTIPGAPTITNAASGNGQITLTWTAPSSDGGSAITSYQYSTDNGAAWTTVPGSGASTTSYTITGLANGTAYNCTVRAVNAAGNGPAATSVSVTPSTTPSAPTGLSLTAGAGQVTVSFSPPSSNGGSTISGYTVTVSPAASGGSTFPAASSPIIITGLTSGTVYTFSVTATNIAGTGPAAMTSGSPFSAPSAPQNVAVTAGDGQATVTFSPPSSNGGSPITDYTVTVTPAGGGAQITEPGTASPITVTGLTNGTSYTFTVTATNNAGTSSASPAVSATPYALPLSPSVSTVDLNNNGQATVSFSNSTSSAANPATSFTVTATPTNGGAPITATGTGSPLTVSGLVAGTSYSISVTATNGRGSTPSSNTIVVTAIGPVQLSTAPLPTAMINAFYSHVLVSTGYPAPTSWSFTGSLPPGLSLNTATGVISGTPSPFSRGTYSITITANGTSTSDTQTITMTVKAPVAPATAADILDFGTWSGVGTATAKIINHIPELDFSNFIALAVADSYKTLTPGLDYTATQGSTIITFTETYLDSLPNGIYEYIAEYTTYDTSGIQLIINKQSNNTVTGGAGEGGRPSTGDDPYTLFLTTLLTIVSALCLFMLMLYYRYTYSSFRTRRR